jgi:hypothetical protein
MDALIGRTGFVGQSLLRHREFGSSYRSTDIEQIEGRRFNRIVCAGVTAVKWWANANAEADLAGIKRLMSHLERVETDRFVLISTIDVYAAPIGVDENEAVPAPGLHPYGLHRALLEAWVRVRFPRHHIIRLPALFGPGLKKNAIYDLLNDNLLANIDPASKFQWYPVDRLANHIDIIQQAELATVNLAIEPVAMSDIQRRFFPKKVLGGNSKPVNYDLRTRYGSLFGGNAAYVMTSPDMLTEMEKFIVASQ